jgi:hypothetical protein
MNKSAMPIKVVMLAAALTLTLPAFSDQTSKGNQSAKQAPVSGKPSAAAPKGGKEPVAHTTTITSPSLSPTRRYTPKLAAPKGGTEPVAHTTTITSAAPPPK